MRQKGDRERDKGRKKGREIVQREGNEGEKGRREEEESKGIREEEIEGGN